MIISLAGGVGGGKLAAGLAAILTPSHLTMVVNTGDDFEHLGLSICPDLDSVMYSMAGINNLKTGWGQKGETWNFMLTLARLGGPTWFNLGDRDLAVHVSRTLALKQGTPLSQVTMQLYKRFGIRHRVLPMSDTPVRTRVLTAGTDLDFQDYFVRLQCKPRVTGFRYTGSRRARPPAELRHLMQSSAVHAVVLCPSNPFVSIAPIFSVPAIRTWINQRSFPVVAVSPLVGGTAIKGPAAKIMRELGYESSALGLARYYGDTVDGWIIDNQDAALRRSIESLDKRVLVTNTMMTSPAKSAKLARQTVSFARELAVGTGRG